MTIEDKIKDLFKDQFPEVELGLAKGEFDWLKTDLVEIVKKEISNALDMIVLERRKKLFIKEYKKDYSESLKYKAGEICEDGDITNQQAGAEETFSIGMPVYSTDGEELGRLSIGLFNNLDYSTDRIEIPVETWRVQGYSGKRQMIKTFYQLEALKSKVKGELK